MTIFISFSGGARVISRETGEVMAEYSPMTLLKLKDGRLTRHIMSTEEWVARTMATAPQFTQRQIDHARGVKRELIRLAEERTAPSIAA